MLKQFRSTIGVLLSFFKSNKEDNNGSNNEEDPGKSIFLKKLPLFIVTLFFAIISFGVDWILKQGGRVDDLNKEISKLTYQNRDLNDLLDKARRELQEESKARNDVRLKHGDLTSENKALSLEVNSLKVDIEELILSNKSKKTRIEELEKELSNRKITVKEEPVKVVEPAVVQPKVNKNVQKLRNIN